MNTSSVNMSAFKDGMRYTSICHVLSGDAWGGAEAQALELIRGLSEHADLCAVVFNRGQLYARLGECRISTDLAEEKDRGLFSLALRVRSILKRRRPDLVHAHGLKENLVAGIAARSLGIPVIRTHHGRAMIGVKMRYTCIERINASFFTDRSIAVSGDLSAFLRMSGLSSRHLCIIRNGIRCRPESVRGSLTKGGVHHGDLTFCIGTVGRLAAVKNHRCLLEAFKIVCDEVDAARLIIVGDGPLVDQLKSFAVELAISSKVSFAGFQRDVGEYLGSLNVFVLSSLHEGVPMALLEAMSMDVPVISTRVGGIPEVITDQYNGLLVDSNDSKSLSAAIVRLAGDRVFARQLAANARSTVMGELSFDRCLASTISLYGETLVSNRSS